MVSRKFDELFDKYRNATCIEDRRIKVKLKEIIACFDECDPAEQEFTSDIIDKFCEMIKLIEERNEDERQAIIFKYDAPCNTSGGRYESFVPCYNNREQQKAYRTADELLTVFYNSFIEKKSASTMKDYVARVRTFAYSERYLGKMLQSGELGISEIYTDPVLFTYENIEIILARFNTKDENGVSIKQKNNIRSALRMLNEFKTFNSVSKANITGNVKAANLRSSSRPGHLVIPEGVTEIKGLEYSNRTDLLTVTIPSTVTKIEAYAFAGCSRLLSIIVSEDNKHFSNDEMENLYNKDKTVLLRVSPCWADTYVAQSSVTCIAPGALEGCCHIPEIILPDTLTEIGAFAFKNCESITEITIPRSVTKIGKDAFKGCKKLTIHTPKGSCAESYAKQCGIPFVIG